jgi:uncharacterized protein YgiB involved in biofilm formation
MKRSAGVRLVLLGSAVGLYSCDNRPLDLQRQRYESLDECRRNWGDPNDCTRPAGGTAVGGGAHGGYYYGPRYYWDPAIGRPVVVGSDGNTRVVAHANAGEGSHFGGVAIEAGSISRGGFGASGRAFGGARG